MDAKDIAMKILYDRELDDMFNRDEYIKAVYTEDGREQGESNRNKAIALNMLKDKAEYDLISKYTGLSLEEIKALEKDLES